MSDRFNNGQALSEDQLRTLVPSIFATSAHHSRSERFRPIPTIEIVRALATEGFGVFSASQSVARLDDRRNFTKHLLRLRPLEQKQNLKVGDTIFEVNMKNANDGTSMYDFFAGLLRIACMNGMVVNRGDIASVNVRHTGDVMNKVIEGTYTVLQTAETALEAPDKWSRIQLASPERMALAEAAHSLRFADNEGNVTTPVKPEQLLMTRRTDDEGHDLWSTFNVIQENVIRGGLHAVGHNANNQVIRRTSRAVKGIDQNVKLNRALWQLGEKMAELKAA